MPRATGGKTVPIEDLPEAAQRLRRLRIAKGYATVASAVRDMHVRLATYNSHENGTRALTTAAAATYGAFFNVSASYILTGESTIPQPRVLLVGHVSDMGFVEAIRYQLTELNPPADPKPIPRRKASTRAARNAADFDSVYRISLWSRRWPMSAYRSPLMLPAPPGITAEQAGKMGVLQVETDALFPVFGRGDRLFYYPKSFRAKTEFDQVHMRRCVVITASDEMLVGWVFVQEDFSVRVLASGGTPEREIKKPKAVWPIHTVTCRATLAI